ncbi:nitroreductase family protein [Peribacillus frigoritolerans]|nr:nitroreductase family protein [Peribacillus frigoritolerans]
MHSWKAKRRTLKRKKTAGQRGYNKLISVPMFVAVIMEENPNPMTREEDYAATSALIQNFSLLAWEQGIGMIWETYGMIHSDEFREALGVKPGEKNRWKFARWLSRYDPCPASKERDRSTPDHYGLT